MTVAHCYCCFIFMMKQILYKASLKKTESHLMFVDWKRGGWAFSGATSPRPSGSMVWSLWYTGDPQIAVTHPAAWMCWSALHFFRSNTFSDWSNRGNPDLGHITKKLGNRTFPTVICQSFILNAHDLYCPSVREMVDISGEVNDSRMHGTNLRSCGDWYCEAASEERSRIGLMRRSDLLDFKRVRYAQVCI